MRKTDIKETTNYDRFHLLPDGFNREIDYKHSARMLHSVTLHENQRVIIVAKLDFFDGVQREYIIDGQHLFQNLVVLEEYVVYKYKIINTKEELVRFIVDMNNITKPWSLDDYIDAWGELKEEYVHLKNSVRRYGIQPQGIAMLGTNDHRRRLMAKVIKSGHYVIHDRTRFRTMARFVVDLINVPELESLAKGYFPNRLIESFLIYYNSVENYDQELIKSRIRQNANIIRGVFAADSELERVLEETIFFITEEQ